MSFVGNIASALIGAHGATQAATIQSNEAQRALQLQEQMWQTTMGNLSPFMQMGQGAGATLAKMLSPGGQLTQSFTPADYLANQDPGYQFQLQQGNKALQASQAAGNGVLAGSSLKDLINYNQGMAATGYQNAFDRWNTQQNNLYSRLMGMTSIGENAAANAGNTGIQAGANMGNTMMGIGNAQAAGLVGATNAITGGINNATGYYQLSQMMNRGTTPFGGWWWNTDPSSESAQNGMDVGWYPG